MHHYTKFGCKKVLIYLFLEGSVNQPHRVTSGLFTKSNLIVIPVEYNTKHADYTNVKHNNTLHNPKVSPFGNAIVKKKGK